MKNNAWKAVIAAGGALMLSAVGLCAYNLNESNKAYETSHTVLEQLMEQIPDIHQATEPPTAYELKNDDLFAEYEPKAVTQPEMGTIEIGGSQYCGFITLPALGIELPVRSEWSYPALRSTPCRYSGTAEGRDLIIAAHNYDSHFGRIDELDQGDEIWFTDVSGERSYYEVLYTELISGSDAESMVKGGAEEWALTLYTCDLSGQSRVTVRAVRQEKEGEA